MLNLGSSLVYLSVALVTDLSSAFKAILHTHYKRSSAKMEERKCAQFDLIFKEQNLKTVQIDNDKVKDALDEYDS